MTDIHITKNNEYTKQYLHLGCIDGTHIVIDPPSTSKDDYIDRKGNTTICMQGICDENRKFINIFVGYPGSCHDSWVLKNSPIYEKLPSYCRGNSDYKSLSNIILTFLCFQIIIYWGILLIHAINI